MDIQFVSKSCVKIILTSREADSLDMDFDSFEKGSPTTKTFLGYILNVMGELGFIRSPYDSISVEVFEQADGDMVIYISSSPYMDTKSPEKHEAVVFFASTDILLDFLCDNRFKISTAQLYSYNDYYALIFEADKYSDTKLLLDSILIAKVKEYGRLICDTPFETLI